ncbi:MAG: 2,3-bisphosphoglycerate-independent phosphoglycerate mutase [Solirubrobacteraceae bacterium]|nr:2,3-bisphosphoglycerate-independent phosphoglycerate mutase [Solirubrobacteraceae bacterium]
MRVMPLQSTFPQVALVILDGWGLAPESPGNAVALANTPVMDELWASKPRTTLTASGPAVGLPKGQMGNSEVGHLNLGAGAVVKQDLTRIDEAVETGALAQNAILRAAYEGAPRVHLVGLVSDGGVHSGWEHLQALIALGKELNVPELVIHAFTDGRDTSPTGGRGYLAQVQEWCDAAGNARVGTIIGRYFGMDRDSRWERTQQAYDLIVHGIAQHHTATTAAAIDDAYARQETDEFITATTVGDEATIRPGDSVIGFNFRPDRVRQISLALADPAFDEIDRDGAAPIDRYVTLTEYDETYPYPIAFPPARPTVTLPKVVAEHGGTQLHVAETEKYPHVTYFFAGGEERPEPGEERAVVPSPRDVPTYDLKPEMSAAGVAKAFVDGWLADRPTFGVINFANADMVGHTGSIPAATAAVEFVDARLGELIEAVTSTGGAVIVTADHGNADEMLEDDGSPDTAHSLNPVPVVIVGDGITLAGDPETTPLTGPGVTSSVETTGRTGALCDIAPTVLALLGYTQPAEMTGRSLV